MRFYIATSLSRAKCHNLVRDALIDCGHEISYDWTIHGEVRSVSKARLREVALLELNGVLESDCIVVLLPGGGGTHLELGFALAKGIKTFLHSEDASIFELGPQTSAFYHHPDVTHLVCPLADVGAAVHVSLSQLAMVIPHECAASANHCLLR